MAYWLLKSEPSAWSWAMQIKAGAKGMAWTGVRNHLAKKNLMAMRVGDRAFFYHSGEGKDIVGIVEVVREHYPDPTAAQGACPPKLEEHRRKPWVVVDVKAVKPFKKPVTLAAIKATPALSSMSLVTSARLSVQPVTKKEWEIICRMGSVTE